MAKKVTDAELKRLCVGCRFDRYNYKGTCERPGIDAPVLCEKCWSLKPEHRIYCRRVKRYVMTCHTGLREQWDVQYQQTGKEPRWRPW